MTKYKINTCVWITHSEVTNGSRPGGLRQWFLYVFPGPVLKEAAILKKGQLNYESFKMRQYTNFAWLQNAYSKQR